VNEKKAVKKYIPMTETMFFILLSLQQEHHGYGIMQHVKQITDSRIILGAGTIYNSLSRLEKDGLIRTLSEDNRRKTYITTELGKKILRVEAKRLVELYENAKLLLEESK
jgi:DNA-binding PadR family transcriptional regulator